jgi:hypothetical protein
VNPDEFALRTGWELKPEGACKDERCVILPADAEARTDVRVLAERIGMPLVHDDEAGLWALGPEAAGRALTSAVAPDFVLPDWKGDEFRLSSLRGSKVLVVAWASW